MTDLSDIETPDPSKAGNNPGGFAQSSGWFFATVGIVGALGIAAWKGVARPAGNWLSGVVQGLRNASKQATETTSTESYDGWRLD